MQQSPTNGSLMSRPNQLSPKELVDAHLSFVRIIASKIHRTLPPGVDLESLIHSGIIGLLEAASNYDETRGVAFPTYARYRIHGEIMEYLRTLDWVSRSVRAWGRKFASARNTLPQKLGREASSEEMAIELNTSLENYYRLDQKINEATLLSLEDLTPASEDNWRKTQEELNIRSFQDPFSFVEGTQLVELAAKAIEELPERERIVITLYYHQELKLREIGEILGLTEGRICQIHSEAVQRLRERFNIEEENFFQISVRRPKPLKYAEVKEEKIMGSSELLETGDEAMLDDENMSEKNTNSSTWFENESPEATAVEFLYSRATKVVANGFKIVEKPSTLLRKELHLNEGTTLLVRIMKEKGALLPLNSLPANIKYWIFLNPEERQRYLSATLDQKNVSRRKIGSKRVPPVPPTIIKENVDHKMLEIVQNGDGNHTQHPKTLTEHTPLTDEGIEREEKMANIHMKNAVATVLAAFGKYIEKM